MADLQAGSTVRHPVSKLPSTDYQFRIVEHELVVLSFCFRRQGALVEKGERLFCTLQCFLRALDRSSTQTATRNFSLQSHQHCGCVVTFRILQDTSVNAYLFLVTLKISPSTWLPLSCMPSSLVYEPLVVHMFAHPMKVMFLCRQAI